MVNRIYENVMRLINEKHMTRGEVERIAGLGNGTIKGWKDGGASVEKVEKVANALGVSFGELIRE